MLHRFWSSDKLTGNQTHHWTIGGSDEFWSSDKLTGNQTQGRLPVRVRVEQPREVPRVPARLRMRPYADFSLYMDMPAPMQVWNRYRSLALGMYWQRNGIPVVPTLSWATPDTYGFCFEGIPRHSTVATSTVGIAADEEAKAVFFGGMAEAMCRLEPARVLVYGADVGFDFGDCEVVYFGASIKGG